MLLSQVFDWLVTADPHLHRRARLAEIYSIATRTVHCAPLLGEWIKTNVPNAWVVGPDMESEQWVASVAATAAAPHATLRKTRRGDRDVEIELPDVASWHGRTPVIVDDIISSARTMVVACRRLRAAGFAAPVCVGIHAIFAGGAYESLREAGAARTVTTNTVAHPSNGVDASDLLAAAARECIAEVGASQRAVPGA
jgi:ribose-phosphate pyrophosphokinase